MSERISEERLRNTRNWAAARIGDLSGAEVIVGAIDELLQLRAAYRRSDPDLDRATRVMATELIADKGLDEWHDMPRPPTGILTSRPLAQQVAARVVETLGIGPMEYRTLRELVDAIDDELKQRLRDSARASNVD